MNQEKEPQLKQESQLKHEEPPENVIQYFIGVVQRQTNLSDCNEIREKLQNHQYNCENVINEYYGITDRKKTNEKVISVNQEIYHQLRNHMNKSKKIL
jgi:hypothetical protein